MEKVNASLEKTNETLSDAKEELKKDHKSLRECLSVRV